MSKQKHKLRWFILSILSMALIVKAQGQSTGTSYIDIDVTHPYYHAIESLTDQAIVKGYQSNNIAYFRPLKTINRAEALKMLMLGGDIRLLENDPQSFPDVPFGAWFSSYINTAASQAIVKGFADGKFRPGNEVTKAEFIKMLVEVFDLPHSPALPGQTWFTPYFESAQTYNILQNTLNPTQNINRGQAADMIWRAQVVQQKNYQPYTYTGSGKASYYNEGFAGRKTASGEIYDPFDLTAAHRTLPFNTKIKVSLPDTDKSVIVRINDRGPYHEDRIIDLSERAFETLAPVSRGILNVTFEILSEESKTVPVPEQIREALRPEVKNPEIPEIVQNEIKTSKNPISETKPRNNFRPVYNQTITTLPIDFFPHFTLRNQIPQKIPVGSMLQFRGITTQAGHKKATVFMQPLPDGEQIRFETPVSGRNFAVPIHFLKPGKFHLGVVFDEERQSRVAEIEVTRTHSLRRFPTANIAVETDLQINVIPEKEQVRLRWNQTNDLMAKITFAQGPNDQKALILNHGLNDILVPYSFFQDFKPDQRLSINLYLAFSDNQTLERQSSAWQKITFANYTLTPGFEDIFESKIRIDNFTRFPKKIGPQTIQGAIIDPSITLHNKAYLTKPNGHVLEVPLRMNNKSDFSIRVDYPTPGDYVFEIISERGEVLFNRGIYAYPDSLALPVFPWPQTSLIGSKSDNIRHWINLLRKQHGRDKLIASSELDTFAQNYAERMANEDFLGHVDPQGRGFGERMREAGFNLNSGENVSFGSTLELALEGLENSGSHRKNILQYQWGRVGIGVHQAQSNAWYVVQVFAK